MSLPAPTHTNTCRLLVRHRSTSINAKTLLATDYLNHFNEVVMILDLLATMPDCLDEALAWQPKSYVEHFLEGGFPDKELAVLAYEQAPLNRRVPFDALIDKINAAVVDGLVDVSTAIAAGDDERTYVRLQGLTEGLREMIARAGGIINGDERGLGSDGAAAGGGADDGGDGGAGSDSASAAGDATTMDQASIDSLFD